MIFEKKVNRSMEWLKEQNKDEQVKSEYSDEEALIEEDLDFKTEGISREKIEKNDILALFLSAFLMFTPIILLVLGIFVVIALLFF